MLKNPFESVRMEPLQAMFLGLVQGLTEFLPVSSSGHLVIFQQYFGFTEPEIFFDVSVHVGTLLAVLIFFRKEIADILLSVCRWFRHLFTPGPMFIDDPMKLALWIVIGSIPTGIIGLGLHKIADRIFASLPVVGCSLIVTGLALALTLMVRKPGKGMHHFPARTALLIGTVQGLAVLPGLSRSGATICAGLFLGIDRETAARYSFLLSVPAILGAELLSILDLSAGPVLLNPVVLIGMATAFVTGYGALALLVYIVKIGRLYLFAPYCLLLGIATLIFAF